ncbi:thioredoxin family protein [Cohaesibacter gelatinilyticus]|uniref:Thioredoxin-related protein n=1 Tax=Cohaesibacter gelatinilyticus TaxID=372072 RepID=A0A285PGZ8_9HYPH|nr:thioredoxin family protein [Cohaesibacter gelatinilyticus]SNZ20984.1 Thioredoxin-related protein [Cohaesibacter gelatinilyticus]
MRILDQTKALFIVGAICLGALVTTPLATNAASVGDDGLHKQTWMRDTFKDLREDLEEATAEGKRLMVMIEQRGCIYCKKMHEEIYPIPEISNFIEENFFVVQINMFGDVEVTDFDGTTMSEKDIVKKWGVLFTPTVMFFGETAPESKPANQLVVAQMPGAFGKMTTEDMLRWVVEKGYAGEESFQKYHARMIASRKK